MEQEHAKVPQSVHSSSAVLTDRREVAGKFCSFERQTLLEDLLEVSIHSCSTKGGLH